jgi:acyl carrier protein
MTSLEELLRQQFRTASIPDDISDLHVGSFPEWNSMAHFNFLLLIEETFRLHFTVDEMSDLKSISDIRARLATAGIAA